MSRGPSAIRVAARWLVAKDGSDWAQFMSENGDKQVKSPDTGNMVKVKSLNRKNRPKSQQLLQDMYEKWKSGGGEDDKGKGTDESDAEQSDLDEPVDLDPDAHIPPGDVSDFLDGTEGPVKDVHDDLKAGKRPPKRKLQQAWMMTVRSLTLGNLKPDQLDRLHETERWLREMAESLQGEGGSKPKAKPKAKPKKKPKPKAEEPAPEPKPKRTRKKKPKSETEPDKAKSDEEIRQEFIRNNPDDKDRIEGMTDEQFDEYVAALTKGKKGSLRGSVVRLAYTRPDLRRPLLTILLGSR